MEPLYEKTVDEKYWWKHKTIKIYQDDDPMNPREWDNLGTIVSWHRAYKFDEDGRKEYGEPNDFLLAVAYQAIMLPVFLLDHSGLSISTTGHNFRAVDSHGWDWGQIGWIYIMRRDAEKEYGSDVEERVKKYMRQEIETLNDYFTGNVLGFTVEDASGKEVDGCWGFYGYDPEKLAEEVLADRV